jgi:hypothetical protein
MQAAVNVVAHQIGPHVKAANRAVGPTEFFHLHTQHAVEGDLVFGQMMDRSLQLVLFGSAASRGMMVSAHAPDGNG